MISSLYIHVPFCIKRCGYCNFYSGEPLDRVAGYPALVAAEAKMRAYQLCPPPQKAALKTLYFGGGTPSLLGPKGLGEIIEAIQAIAPLERDAEVTVEVNPSAQLPFSQLSKLGITRVSVGVQALDEENLSRLGRTHTAAEALETINAALGAGLHVSADLIYGYRGLTSQKLTAAATKLVSCGIEHLSAYSLEEVETLAPASSDRKEEPTEIAHCDPEEEMQQVHALTQTLAGLGLERYEVSNFARPGFESRHNTNYWEGSGYLGLGPGAHGYLPEVGSCGERYENVPDLTAYEAALKSGKLPPMNRELLTQEKALMERLLLNLRRTSGFSSKDLLPDGPEGLEALKKLLSQLCRSGDLVSLGTDFAPTPSGLERADGLALWLFERLKS